MEDIQKQLSRLECTKILENCLNRTNIKLISYSIESLSDKIEGFLGQHYVITINYEENGEKTQRCFMKVLNGSMKIIFEVSLSLNAYEKEKFLYLFLFKEFEKLKFDVSFAPRGYFCKPYLIVLEDLSLRGYRNAPKMSFLDLEHCKVAMRTLAKFHATSILYEDTESKKLEKEFCLQEAYPDMFEDVLLSSEENLAKKWMRHSLEGIFGLIELIPENHISKRKFAEKLQDLLKEQDSLSARLTKFKSTMLHGDLWSNNFLFKYKEGKPETAILLDYQILKYGPPAVDVIQMIFSNTRKSFRQKHYDELLGYYYSCLRESVLPLSLEEIIPKNSFLQLCTDLRLPTKVHCICDRATTLIPDDAIGDIATNDELFRKYLFEDRAKVIVESFNRGGSFKEIMEEDMCELRDMLEL